MAIQNISIQPKTSGSKSWGKAIGPAPDLEILAHQVRTRVKPASGNQVAHIDLTFHQTDLALRKGARIQQEERKP
jgi:hypothetical protein